MAAKTDLFSRLGQEEAFIACMYRMATDTLFIEIRLVDTARSAHRFFMTVETEFIGRGLG